MAIRAVSFDFWNTLFTEQPGGFELYQTNRRRMLERALAHCGSFTADQLDHACLMESQAHYAIWREEHRTLPTAQRVDRILLHLDVRLPDVARTDLVSHYEEGLLMRPPILVPGARETIERLSGAYRLGIISDVGFSPGRVLRHVLRDAGLLDAFDSVVFSDEAGRSKPHLEVFERTARALGVGAAEMAHIGDLEYTDIVGAKRAGSYAIRFVGVTPMEAEETSLADRITEDLFAIPELVRSFETSDY